MFISTRDNSMVTVLRKIGTPAPCDTKPPSKKKRKNYIHVVAAQI